VSISRFTFEVSIPANTAESARYTERFSLVRGVIDQLVIGYPPGCARLAYISFWYRGVQRYPETYPMGYAWDNIFWVEEVEIDLTNSPYVLDVSCWNLDTTFEHTLTLWVRLRTGETKQGNLLTRLLYGS
jgi:hypothetical protein